jgi:hypothetical protein
MAIWLLTLPELNRLTSDGIMSSGLVGSGKGSDIGSLLFVLLETVARRVLDEIRDGGGD